MSHGRHDTDRQQMSGTHAEDDGHRGENDHHDHSHDRDHSHDHDHDMSSMSGMGSMADHFRRLFWANLVLALPVFFLSKQAQDWFGYTIAGTWAEWLVPILGTIIYFWGGWVFLTGAVSELKQRQPGMMTLISMAITVSFVSSLLGSLGIGDFDFWWELAALIVVMLLGHWQEMRAIGQAGNALAALAELLPDKAEIVDGDDTREVAVDDLEVGDVVLVRPGGRVPADGTISHGTAEFDESMITGESKPVKRTVGDRVAAGTVSTDSPVRIHVSAIGDDTTLAGIRKMVAEAQSTKTRTQALADRAAAFLFYVATGVAIITFIVWMLVGDTQKAISHTIAVLVIACPHALGLAIPLVVSISTSLAAKAGILVKNRLALEEMRNVNTVLFDKTGTLTKGDNAVTDVAATDGWSGDRVIAMAAAAESESEHPVAKAIVANAHQRHLDVPAADDRSSTPGRGVSATVDDHLVMVGGPSMFADKHLTEPDDVADKTERWRGRGASVIDIAVGGDIVGALALSDEIRATSKQAVHDLQQRKVRVAMITGDAQQVADAVAGDLGIDEVFAQVLPEDKQDKVAAVQKRGDKVAMVGDGVNDAPALAKADVGIAIGAGTDVAVDSADVVLASDDPRGVASLVTLSKATYKKMVQNLIWATAYNTIAIPVAAGVFSRWGVSMPPALAAIAMSLSTIIVAINAQTLRSLRLR